MDRIILKNVRLSFPSLFKKARFDGKEGKYEATLLIPKTDTNTLDILRSEIKTILDTNKVKISPDKLCMKDGDEKEYDGYDGCYSLKASSTRRPHTVDRDNSPVTEEDGILYPGCYVNAIVDFWFQNNTYGKRINANLYGVQFLKDGPRFGGDTYGETGFSPIFEDGEEARDLIPF